MYIGACMSIMYVCLSACLPVCVCASVRVRKTCIQLFLPKLVSLSLEKQTPTRSGY